MDSTLALGALRIARDAAAKRYVNGSLVEREKGDVWNRERLGAEYGFRGTPEA